MSIICCDSCFVCMHRNALSSSPKAVIDRNGVSYRLHSGLYILTQSFWSVSACCWPQQKKGVIRFIPANCSEVPPVVPCSLRMGGITDGWSMVLWNLAYARCSLGLKPDLFQSGIIAKTDTEWHALALYYDCNKNPL